MNAFPYLSRSPVIKSTYHRAYKDMIKTYCKFKSFFLFSSLGKEMLVHWLFKISDQNLLTHAGIFFMPVI